MTITNSLLIENGQMRTASGWRQIVITREGEVRPVQSIKTGGYLQSRGTKQIAREGDLVFRNEYYPIKHRVYYVKNGVLEPHLQMTPKQASFVTPAIKTWLQAVGLQESYLPVGIGWDGINTVASQKREQRIRALFSGIPGGIIDDYFNRADKALPSERDGMPLSWREDAMPLPCEMACPAEFWDGNLADVRDSTEWVLFHYDGTVEHLVPEPTEGSWGYANRHGGSGWYDAPALPIPATVRSAIRVRIGCYRDEGYSRGIAWELYRRDKR